MDLNTKLVIKVQFNDEIRKMPIHNEDITYDELIIMMERVFKHKLNTEDEIIIKYKDEDNDLITISDDSDLAFAIESSNILKLSLTVENTSKEEDKLSRNLSSDEISSIRRELQIIRDHTNRLLDKLVHSNEETAHNAITSGRASAIGGKDFQEIGGKEFDPLSVGNHSQFQTLERTETASSLISNSRHEDNMIKSNTDHVRLNNQDTQSDSHEIHRPSPVNLVKNQAPMGFNTISQPPMQSSISNTPSTMSSNMPYNMGIQNLSANVPGKNMPSSMGGPNIPPSIGQNLPPNMPNLSSQNMPPNMGGQNMPPNMGGQNMPPNMGGQNMPPNMGGQNMPPNMGGQNMPPNMGGQNMPPNTGGQNMQTNMGGQNMPPNMGSQNIPPNMGGQNMPPNMGNQNMPPNMGAPNISKTMENQMHAIPNAPSVFTGNSNSPVFSNPSTIQGQMSGQRNFYSNAIPVRPSNFQGMGNPMVSGRPPGANPYFNPQSNSPQFNSHNYGYQSTSK